MKGALPKRRGRQSTASKTPVAAKKPPTLAGTGSQAGKTKVQTLLRKDPETQLEKLDFLRSKLEQLADEFIKARKELEEILSPEGSSEQLFLTESSSAELQAELQRHRELTSKVESSLRGSHQDQQPPRGGGVKQRSSYEFLKSILG